MLEQMLGRYAITSKEQHLQALREVMQEIALAGLFILATILVFSGVAITAGRLRTWLLKSERMQLWINRLAGTVFVGLALRLATAQQ